MLKLENISYTVGYKDILREYNLNIKAGEHCLILGPSGCGKTSLMNIMAGLLKPSSGDVIFENQSYNNLSEAMLDSLRAQNFGFIFQQHHLIKHLNVEQNIGLAQHTPDMAIIQTLIEDLGLAGKGKQKARDLSAGEAQRVGIARALANNPAFIFADEPTSALDDINTNKVMDLLFRQSEKYGATIIATTHDSRIRARFNKIVEMQG